EMPPRVLMSIGSNASQHIQPAGVAGIVLVHEADLTEMNRLDAGVDIAGHQEIKPHARLQPAHVRNRAVPPMIHKSAIRIEHVSIIEGTIGHSLAEFLEDPFGN